MNPHAPSIRYAQRRSPLAWAACVWFATCVCTLNAAESDPPESVADFLSANCIGCHDPYTSEGGLDLESLSLQLDDPDNFHLWERVFDRVGEGEMPPDEELDEQESTPFLADLHGILQQADSDRISQTGRAAARRLTRAQYERNVCRLLAINLPLSEYLPEDSLADGFDTVSKSQQISDHSMAAYLQAADAALDASFARLCSDAESSKVHLDWTKLRRSENRTNRMPEGRPEHKDIVSWSTRQNFYGRMPGTSVPTAGRYRIRISVQAVHPPTDGRVWCSVQSGVCSAKASTMYWIGSFEATDEPAEHEFEAWIREGHMLQVLPNDSGLRKVPVPTLDSPAGTVEAMGIPGVAIKWIDMQRIDSELDEVRSALIGDLAFIRTDVNLNSTAPGSNLSSSKVQPGSPQTWELVSQNPKQDLQNLVHSFAQRAFRRPVSIAEVSPYVAFANHRLDAGGTLLDAVRAAYRTILCSPRFLYFEESAGKLDDHALANRLSHFLWGIGPDDELTQLAVDGKLSDPATLRRQTDRLLDDPRSETFVHEFTDQWLMLYEINSTTPDGNLYPEYDDVLHHTLVQETHAFVRELLDRDLPACNIVDSDFTFLNSRLARHYDIKWPGGTGLRRVTIQPDHRRGGVITHASVLKVTANGTTTSPIIRGVWMLERIMGQHVPPPPANVGAVEPDIRGATSIRDQLDKHKALESCASCHVKIDPPGFALESYDVIGGWRESYRAVAEGKGRKWKNGLPVDPSHEFANGDAFDDISGMKRILGAHPEAIAKNMAMHFVTYSTGAEPTYAERETLASIVAATKSDDYGVRSILHQVVQSPLFRNK